MDATKQGSQRITCLMVAFSLLLFIAIAGFAVHVIQTRYTEVSPATNIRPVSTLPPPLESVDFPSQTIAYPIDWPVELRYPDQFKLVDAVSGILPDSSTRVHVAKLLYPGTAQDAENLLSSFFTRQGLQIAENNKLDDGGFQLLLQGGDKQHSGIVVIDPDTNNQKSTRILATIWLPLFP